MLLAVMPVANSVTSPFFGFSHRRKRKIELSDTELLGLVTGTAVLGAVFAVAVGTRDIAGAAPEAVACGMRFTFAVAAGLVAVALVIALVGGGRTRSRA